MSAQSNHRRSLRRRALIVAAALLPAFLVPAVARGSGIEVPMQDAKAAGQADAFTAQADDPAAIHYNPAGITQLHGTQISLGVIGLQPDFHFHGGAGDEHMRLPSVIPTFDVVSDLGTEKWRVGFGAHAIYGLNEDWGNQGPLRTLVDKARLSVVDFSPAVAYKVNDQLSLGATLDVYFGSLQLQRNVVLAAPPVPEGDFRLTGTDWAVGVTPSVHYQIDRNNSIGAYYRSPFTLDFGGRARLIDSGVIPKIGGSRAHAPLDFPQSVGLGYSTRLTPKLNLEGDVIWTDWHSVDELRIHSPNAAFNNQTLPADWKSGFTFRAGAKYDLTPHWTLRGGYAFSQNAVPASTFSPLVPDSNYHLFALGTGYDFGRCSIDAAYNFIFRERRHIAGSVNSPTVDGTWGNQVHAVLITFNVKL